MCKTKHKSFYQAQDGQIDETKKSYCGDSICKEPIVNLRSCVRYNMTLTAFSGDGRTETYPSAYFGTLDQGFFLQ